MHVEELHIWDAKPYSLLKPIDVSEENITSIFRVEK
jgi:hypothetical protein